MRSMAVCPLNSVVCRRMATKLPRKLPTTICRESPTHQLRHFVGIAVLKPRPMVLWLRILVFLSVVFPTSCSNFCLEKNYLRCLRFWFGGNLERELGEAFFPPQFTVRESEVSNEDFLCVSVNIRRWQAAPSFYFIFFLGLSLIKMGLACLYHPTFF